MEKSEIYILNLYVNPGGARLNLYCYITEFDKLISAIINNLKNPYLPVWYGLDAYLYIGKLTGVNINGIPIYSKRKKYDILKYIKYQIGDFSPILFKKSNSLPIGYYKSNIFDENYIDFQSSDPINFNSTDVNEVSRYLHYNINEMFRTGSSKCGSEPPKVQIDLIDKFYQDVPKIFQSKKYDKIIFEVSGDEIELQYGTNNFD